jgi:hypothetical protein
MSTAKERKYRKTNKALWDALERLKKDQPVCDELKRRPKLKVNNYAVEKEAGLSVGVLKNHPDVKEAIKEYQDEIAATKHGLSDRADVAALKLAKLKGRLKKEVALKKQNADEVYRLTESMKIELAAHHQLVKALFDKVPYDERESLMRHVDNVVPLHRKDR